VYTTCGSNQLFPRNPFFSLLGKGKRKKRKKKKDTMTADQQGGTQPLQHTLPCNYPFLSSDY
jgi:hypothetical protein